jgi:glucose-1-phosphate cytidylyltransferase
VIDRITDDATIWEDKPLSGLANDGQLSGFKHEGFWHPMDTLREKIYLNELWNVGKAPWKVWK